VTAPPGPDGSVGPLSEEAARLFAAAQAWLGEHAGSLSGHVAVGATECHLCPLCQMIGLFKTAKPEVVEHLADASASIMAAVRVLLESHERQWAAQRAGRSGTGVEHIDIG
jgi:Family of unknown function (DUF5304)